MLKHSIEALSEILSRKEPGRIPSSGDLFSSNSVGSASLHDVYRADKSDGLLLPNVIVPASGDVEDFFASVATYYQGDSPITSITHVLSKETVSLFSEKSNKSKAPTLNYTDSSRMACLGAAMGEAVVTSLLNDTGATFSYATCRRTLAFSLCRAKLIYGDAVLVGHLAERWVKLRQLTGLNSLAHVADVVLFAHQLAFGEASAASLHRIDPNLREKIVELSKLGGNDENLIGPILSELYPKSKRYADDLKAAFDGRMNAFTKLIEVIHAESRGIHTDEIAVAFFCNRILPGSFAHIGVLAPLVGIFPSALVWYGFFAALSRPATDQLSPNLISKLERDLLDPFSFELRPRCDIAFEELEVLSRASLKAEIVKPSQQRALLVALIPGVEIYTRFGSDNDVIGEKSRREAQVEELQSRAERLLEEAIYTLKKATATKKGATTKAASPRQRKDR